MISKSADFEHFMEVHFPDAYRRLTSEDVKEDVYVAIFSEYEARFKKWQSVPQWIKDFYRDVLPPEVLNGNITVDDFVENLEYVYLRSPDNDIASIRSNNFRNVLYVENMKKEEYEDKISKGYSTKHAIQLVENKHVRDCLCAACHNRKMTEEERKIWHDSRKRDIHIIEESFRKDQPEKMAYHSIKQYDINMRKMRKEKLAKKKVEYFLKAMKCKYEIFKHLSCVKDKKLRRGLMRMYIVSRDNLGYKRMSEERKKIAKYVVAKPPKKRVNKKAMADVMAQLGVNTKM